MNIYEVSTGLWLTRVKASSVSVAISRGLKSIGKKAEIDSRDKKAVHVTAKVIARNVRPDTEIPPFENERRKETVTP